MRAFRRFGRRNPQQPRCQIRAVEGVAGAGRVERGIHLRRWYRLVLLIVRNQRRLVAVLDDDFGDACALQSGRRRFW